MEEWAAVLGEFRFREVSENTPAGRGTHPGGADTTHGRGRGKMHPSQRENKQFFLF